MITVNIENDIALIELNDGKANVISKPMSDAIIEALEQAMGQAKATVITAAGDKFSAGFDLSVFKNGTEQDQQEMSAGGFNLLYHMYSHPQPLVAACNGHAIGMGAFLLLCSDSRIGVKGDYKIGLPETAIGMPFTPLLKALIQDRVSKQFYTAAALQSQMLKPEQAVAANFLDALADQDSLLNDAKALAKQLTQLPKKQYGVNKQILRSEALAIVKAELAGLGIKH